jgi:hypothetical protein
MPLSKLLACTLCAIGVVTAAACANGSGTPFTPTLPSTTNTVANADGTTLKASAPTPQAPPADAQVANLRPTLTIGNAAGTFDQVPLSYVFQLYEGDTLLQQTDSVAISAQSTSWEVPTNLLNYQRTYRWRARATSEGLEGPWSAFTTFRTGEPPAVNDSPGPVPCAGSSGPEIIQCVAAAYPEKLEKTSTGDFSDERRAANMEFIRDRIIETGKCKGMNLGQNFKRGTPVISKDFIVLRSDRGKNGRDRGVDIARGYDATSTRLQLAWLVFDADKNWGHPFYKDYGPVDCSGM